LSFLGFENRRSFLEALQNYSVTVTKLSGFSHPAASCRSLNILHVTRCYAVLKTEDLRFAMPHSDLLPSLLYKINENQLALEAAIMELSNWVEVRGSADVADNVRGALDTIDKNEEFIKLTLAVLMAPE
jgi:hypothetical protein